MDHRLKNRLDVQNALEDILGARRVYFQPMSTERIEYPSIVYHLQNIKTRSVNGRVYKSNKVYQITYMTRSATDALPDKLLQELPMIKFNTTYTREGLYHYIFTLET